jgi:2,3-dihydroxybiphenyl 1,2-dioxygenase
MTADIGKACVTQLGYLGFGVSNLDQWLAFCRDVLGLQHNGTSQSGSALMRTDAYHHRIEIVPSGEDDVIFHGWEVKDAEALDQIAAQVRAYGIEVEQGAPDEAAHRMVLGLIKFKDPDGLATEVYYGPLVDHSPFVSPRGFGPFICGPLGVGHTVMAVQDMAGYVKFYTEVLGARLSDFIQFTAGPKTMLGAFMRVNARHHSLAVAPRRPGSKRLHHFMLEAQTIDQVGLTLNLFHEKAIGVGSLGRHTNDHMLSVYGDTPSGFSIEYGWGGLLIEDESKWDIQYHKAASLWGHVRPPSFGDIGSARAAQQGVAAE